MKLIGHFKSFLRDTVNINQSRLDLLDSRVDSLSDYLSSCESLKALYVDTIPQGSMAHETIIKPMSGREFDADILLVLEENQEWKAKDYIENVYQAFRLSGIYKDKVSRKSRCVRVQYAGDCHVDVVPYMERHGLNYITNRNDGDSGVFERTDPTAYTAWFDEQNRVTNGNLIRVIRLLKWLRDYKGTFTCKSVILNALIGERVSGFKVIGDENYYSDVPTTLVNLLEDLSQYLEPFETVMPRVADPVCSEIDFNHRWNEDQFFNFRKKMQFYASKARAAYDETDRIKSISLWRELFGDKFAPDVEVSRAVSPPSSIVKTAPNEEFIDSKLNVTIEKTEVLKIVGRVEPRPGFLTYDLPTRGNRVKKGAKLRFRIVKCTVAPPYDIFWKVRNRGSEAEDATCLRGEIIQGSHSNGSEHQETTLYRGNHYVECYIVKDDKCLAVDRQQVRVL